MANQIQLTGGFIHEEADASGVVKPGMLLELTSADVVKAHATEGGYSERAFAVEDALQGDTVDDSYADGALVSYHLVEPGAKVQALIKAGEDISIGDRLVSAGDGTLIAEDSVASGTTVKQIIAVAAAACDLSDSGDADTLSAVRVM